MICCRQSFTSGGASRIGAVVVAFGFFISVPWAHGQPNKITATLDGITFDSAYDNGSLAGVTRLAYGDYEATTFTESGERGTARYWFRFTMSGVADRAITLRLDHTHNPVPFLRILAPGPGPWRRMTASEAPNTSTLVLTFGPDTQAVELAFFEPMGHLETLVAVTNIVSSSPYAAIETIGKSFEDRDIHLVTVNDSSFPEAGKKRRVWVHTRVHAGEVTSTHTMLGFLEQILEDSPTGRRLRELMTFHVVPQVNVDGIWRGHTRWDAQGVDIEREWCGLRVPEAAALKTQVDAFMATPNPISVALNLHSTVGNFVDSFFFKHVVPSVSANFELIQQRYIDALAGATPLFNNLSPHTSQLHSCAFIESYFWNNWGESVMALTKEGHYYRRITDNAWTDGAHYRAIGRAMARALIGYYDLPPAQEPILFADDFDGYPAPLVVTNAVPTNNYRLVYGTTAGSPNFTAIFGFDYSTVDFPLSIPPAPHSTGGTTKGLYLTVNKNSAYPHGSTSPAGNAAAVNLYPIGLFFSNDFALKFDLWLNWTNTATSTEHAIFGINHSGALTNRVEQMTSDGLFFGVSGDGGVSPTSTNVRDFAVLRGGGPGAAPILMVTNNTVFGPTPPLGPQFDHANPGFVGLFPALPVYGGIRAGSAGLRWVSVEVRQESRLITWLLNGAIVAQYTNQSAFTNGAIMVGYNDVFASLGDTNNFVLFDNLRVESIPAVPVELWSPRITAGEFQFSFATEPYKRYTVEHATSLSAPDWVTVTNVVGDGHTGTLSAPLQPGENYFRVRSP
jgi:hypothetical protein